MKLEECYKSFGGSYEDVKTRLQNDAIVQRLVIKFLADPSYTNLCEALEQGNYEEAFRAAHSLKGVCQNLSFVNLSQSSSLLTELLRGRQEQKVDQELCNTFMKQVTEDYEAVTEAIRRLQE